MTTGRLLLAFFACSFMVPADAFGQAYCALRDPTRHVYKSFPEAKTYRSIVRTVDESVRQQVSQQLPFTLHFNELGRHTVYVPVVGERPLGLIHARSEKGRWGLVEIVWSLDPGMHVLDYTFQRCRSRAKTAVETDKFKQQLIGKGFNDLRKMLSEDGKTLRPGALKVAKSAEDLAATLIRSALKTIAVTRLVWSSDLSAIQPLYNAHEAFPETVKVEVVGTPYSSQVMSELSTHFGADSTSPIQRDNVTLYRAYNAEGRAIGHVVRTPWSSLGNHVVLWWAVEPGVSIRSVSPEQDWPDRRTAAAFLQVKGLNMDGLKTCATTAELTGAEVLLLSQQN